MIQIHVDVDNMWVYENAHSIKTPFKKEDIYTKALPIFLNILKKTNSKATFMIIGADLEMKACRDFCKKAITLGHEIGNHSWSHSDNFGQLSHEGKKQEIQKTHTLLTKVCGQKPIGFRGPGYYIDVDSIKILQELGYKYDSSVLPGLSQTLMKLYIQVKNKKGMEKIFKKGKDLMSKHRPYVLSQSRSKGKLWELPISVFPIITIPIHSTFIYFLGPVYKKIIILYLKSKKGYLLYLFHAIDFLEHPSTPNHPIIPFRYSLEERIAFSSEILNIFVKNNKGSIKTSRELLGELR